MELVRLLHRTGRPLFLAVNKIDSDKQEHLAENFRTLGIRNVYPISAEHGIGVGELLEAVFEIPAMKEKSEAWKKAKAAAEELELSYADQEESLTDTDGRLLVLRLFPLKSKSPSLAVLTWANPPCSISSLADRSIVSPIAGTTRDAIDEVLSATGSVFVSSTRPEFAARANEADGGKAFRHHGAQASGRRRHRALGHRRARRGGCARRSHCRIRA